MDQERPYRNELLAAGTSIIVFLCSSICAITQLHDTEAGTILAGFGATQLVLTTMVILIREMSNDWRI